MFRSMAVIQPRLVTRITPSRTAAFCNSSHLLAAQPKTTDEDELVAARRWLNSFDAETIPRSICDVSFSRSSGPGGQNVNKVSSKATLRVPLSSLLPLLPPILRPEITKSRYCAAKSDSLVVQADDSRKQTDNVHRCFAKLHEMIVQAGREVVPGETSVEQLERVKKLQKAENEGRLKLKKKHSDKKSARRSGGKSDY